MSTKTQKKKSFNVLSLFAGCGGLDIGFMQAGFKIVASVEINKTFCETLKKNASFFGTSHKVICEDITAFKPKNYSLGRIDFIIGGPPCQSFSAAGRRAGGVYGINDSRGSLFWHYCRLINELKPKGFLFENVRGILSANKGQAWRTIVSAFNDVGYSLRHAVLDAAEYGVPQHRERLILIGTRSNLNILFPYPTHGPLSSPQKPYLSSGLAIKDLQCTRESYTPYGGKYEKCLKEIPPGLNYLFFTEKMGHKKPLFAWRSRFSDFLYVADPAKPTKTIVASPGKWAGPFHWNKRKFTLKELKRLFSYPDSYELFGSDAEKIKQLGNSVPPVLAKILASSVLQQLFGVDKLIKLAPDGFKFHHDSRKGEKAKDTKTKVLSNKIFNGYVQPDFFEIFCKKWPRKSFSFKYHYPEARRRVSCSAKTKEDEIFEGHADLRNGDWQCNVSGTSTDNISLLLTVEFHRPIADSFKKIIIKGFSLSDSRICQIWDLVNDCISYSSSYDNIQKLYGHFTEPYPQFQPFLDILNCNNEFMMTRITKEICSLEFVKRYHQESLLRNWIPHLKNNSERAQILREHGFDIRVNQTNRTIPEGYFRVCYPFPTPLNTQSFVSWTKKGDHKTADIKSANLASIL